MHTVDCLSHTARLHLPPRPITRPVDVRVDAVCEQLKADAICRLEAVHALGTHPRVEHLYTIYLHMAPLAARRAACPPPPLRLLLSSLERRRGDGQSCAVLQHRWRHCRVVVKVLRILAVVNVLRLLRVLRPVRVGIDRGIGRDSRDSGDS